MILRKKNIAFVIIAIVVIVFLSLTVLGILYLKTDMFKSNETLFAKYFIQNFDIIEILKNEDALVIEKILNENKYTSKLQGKVEYTENIGTSDENKNNPINNIEVKINSDIDNINNYMHRDFRINSDNDNLVKFEYIKQNQNYGIRLDGIQQFISVDTDRNDEVLEELKLGNIEGLFSKIDINSVLNFNEEEKQNLINTYIRIIQTKITKDRYYKQSNSLITVNDKDIQTNAYYMKLTIEEYNTIVIDILTQITQDEIILSRIDLIENEIKEKYSEYDSNESLRNQFINIVNDKIKKIQDNNIGNDEVRITVYENNEKTVRTSIEKNIDMIIIDLYDDSSVNISKTELGNIAEEAFIKIQKQKDEVNNNILLEYGLIQNNETVNNLKCNYQQTLKGNKINKKIDAEISNQKNMCILNIVDNIEIIQDFSDKVTLDMNNINLNDLQKEKVDIILEIVRDNIEGQLSKLFSVVRKDDYRNILRNLGFINNTNRVELPSEGTVSETQKKRFNSQFEFFVSENLTTDNIKELINVSEKNFEDMKVLLKTGEIEDLNVEKLNSSEESRNYVKNISEILIFVKNNTYDKNKKENTIALLEKNTDNKYNVFLQYDENGLVRLIRIQIQDK